MDIDLIRILIRAQEEASKFVDICGEEGRYNTNDPNLHSKIVRHYTEAYIANAIVEYHKQLTEILKEKGIEI